MFRNIMVPVDLVHKEQLAKALDTATALAKSHGAELTLVSVTGSGLSEVARNEEEFASKLTAFASNLSDKSGIQIGTRAVHDNDVAADLGDVLIEIAATCGHDLIVMASHKPGLIEYIFASHAGYVASHAKCSVFVIR